MRTLINVLFQKISDFLNIDLLVPNSWWTTFNGVIGILFGHQNHVLFRGKRSFM